MDPDIDARYVNRHFWTLAELSEAVASSPERVGALIAARCAPGPVYIRSAKGWWSALERRVRPAPSGDAWYSPGAAWGLRRALLAERGGATDDEAAAMLERSFCDEFVQALREVDGAELAFPDCFDGTSLDATASQLAGRKEWNAWLDGGYAVCLRVFTGRGCVVKETLGASVKAALEAGDYDADVLLGHAEALAEIMLPFAPWQRANGTPGRTIDRLLLEPVYKVSSEASRSKRLSISRIIDTYTIPS